jgi:hypothetical protein
LDAPNCKSILTAASRFSNPMSDVISQNSAKSAQNSSTRFDEGFDGRAEIITAWSRGLAPDPALTVSAWADRYRFLSSRASSEAGRYRIQTSLRSLYNRLTMPDALHARRHGCTLARQFGPADRVHEGGAGRRDRGREQLDRLLYPSGAGSIPRRPADSSLFLQTAFPCLPAISPNACRNSVSSR